MSSPKSFRSRMGGVMRRTSSVLAIARPTTPTPSTPPAEDSRRSSISKSQEGRKSTTSLTLSGATPPAPEPAAESQPPAEPETTGDTPTLAAAEDSPAPQTNGTPKAVKRLLPIAVQYQQYPSPIAESPAREAAATTEDGTGASGPSPLGQASEAVPIAQDQVASVPAEPEALAVSAPQASEGAEVPRVPVSEAEQEQEAPPATAVEEAYVHPALILDSSNPGAFTDEPNEMHKEPHPEPTERATEEAPRPVAAVEPVAAQEYAYFDLVRPVGPAVHDVALASPGSGRETVVAEEQAHISPYPYDMQPAQSQPEPEPEPVPAVAPEPVPAADPVPLAAEQSGAANTDVPRPMQWDDASGWDSGAVFMPISATLPATTEITEDPFADPPHVEDRERGDTERGGLSMPIAERGYVVDEETHGGSVEAVGGVSTIVMPMPPEEPSVVPAGSIRTMPSAENPPRSSQGHFQHTEVSTDERRPLLSPPPSPDARLNYLAAGNANANGSHSNAGSTQQTFHDLGWIEYVLPDITSTYYVHPTLRVTTDVNLRSQEALNRVGHAVGYMGEGGALRPRMELWLRGGVKDQRNSNRGVGKGKRRGDKRESGLVRWWVDHAKREASCGEDAVEHEDHLDMEYRYWAFMESHPAHAALPFAARREAMDVLTWTWTDRLLPPHPQSPLPPPFTPGECQELLGVVRSFGDITQTEVGIQSIVLTRIVSRVLLRVAHWRQHHFRPDKPLPTDTSGHSHVLRRGSHRTGFARKVFEVLVSCLLFGVPFLFYNRVGYNARVDAEGGTGGRSSIPVLIVGACTCLLAAILLSASITFLSLPGLDNVARVAAFVVILLAACSMASSVVALFRYKADLANAAQPDATQLNPARVGGEGLMPISTRSVIMSLPLVFLIYAVIGFIAAVVVYSFLGVNGSAVRFEDYTRWTVLGVLGGLLGVLTTSVLLLR